MVPSFSLPEILMTLRLSLTSLDEHNSGQTKRPHNTSYAAFINIKAS